MNTTLLITFIVLSIVNVILQTVKSIVTIKCGKISASVVNAVAFGLYTIVTVYTMCDLPLMIKALVVALCNLVGVFIVKCIEEKTRKDKLWKVELTVRADRTNVLARELEELAIPYNYIPNVGKYTVFNIYCATQKESAFVKELTTRHKAKYFVTESKAL
jgi:uncharacterized protein YebE (UPF0316 family)